MSRGIVSSESRPAKWYNAKTEGIDKKLNEARDFEILISEKGQF